MTTFTSKQVYAGKWYYPGSVYVTSYSYRHVFRVRYDPFNYVIIRLAHKYTHTYQFTIELFIYSFAGLRPTQLLL